MIISKPYVTSETNEYGTFSKICADIEFSDKTKNTLFFTVPKAFEEYLTLDRCDGFLIGLLPLAIGKNEPIKCMAPVSEKLLYNINSLYLKTLLSHAQHTENVKIEAKSTNTFYNPTSNATAISAGVDSFYSIFSNLSNQNTKSFNLTHLTFFNVGALGYYGGSEARKRFTDKCKVYGELSEKLGLTFLPVDSNISEILMMDFNVSVTFRCFAAVLVLQKLFRNYYFSSSRSLDSFMIDLSVSEGYDLLNCYALSTENTTFFTTGSEATRLEKLKEISKYAITKDYLNVCDSGSLHNCGNKCLKCLRTELELYSLNLLDEYKKVFDVDDFKKHKAGRVAKIIEYIPYSKMEGKWFKECKAEAKRNNVHIPFASYIIALPGYIKFSFMAILKKSKVLRGLVHKRISKDGSFNFIEKR